MKINKILSYLKPSHNHQERNIYSEKLDFPHYPDEPKKVICLCFIPRSASNFLADEMRKTGLLGYPLEYFSYTNTARLMKRFAKFPSGLYTARTSPNGVFSFKWNSTFGYLPVEPDYYIFLDRWDTFAQARSYVVADKTGDWLKIKNRDYSPSREEILEKFILLKRIRVETLNFLRNKTVLELKFDEVTKYPEIVIQKILEFCEV